MEILPLILFMPIRFFPYVLAALIRLQWVALAILVLFFASYFICTLFVDKQSRMQLSLSRLEPLFTALLQYVLSKWEEIEMSDAKGWFLESLIGRIERICRRIRVKSFYEALSKTVQYIARESIPIVTSWLVYRYTLLHYNGHASGDYLNMATKASENTFLSSLVDNRKALKFMGDGCQEIVDNYIFFETLYSNVKSLRPLLSLTESHPFRSRRHFPFDKHKNHVSLAEGELLFSKEVLIDFKEVHVDAPRKSVDEIPHCILKDISFQILSGENWLITGPSGKTYTQIFLCVH